MTRISEMLPRTRSSWQQHVKEAIYAALFAILLTVAWVAMIVLFGGCCKVPPVQYVKVPVAVVGTCKLPGELVLPGVMRQVAGCPEKLVCYDIANAAKIADREDKLKTWVKEARAACTSVSQPAKPAPK